MVNTLPEVTQLLLGQERHCQGLLDVLQPDQTQGPQVVSVCGAPGAGTYPCFKIQGHIGPVCPAEERHVHPLEPQINMLLPK